MQTVTAQTVTAQTIEAALSQRLRAVKSLLSQETAPTSGEHAALDAANMLDLLVRAVRSEPTPARIWLLCSAVSGSLPTHDDVVIGMRHFRLASTMEATLWLLDYALDTTKGAGGSEMDVRVVSNGVVVDVNHTARHDLHTGIQQVVRQVLPLWRATMTSFPSYGPIPHEPCEPLPPWNWVAYSNGNRTVR